MSVSYLTRNFRSLEFSSPFFLCEEVDALFGIWIVFFLGSLNCLLVGLCWSEIFRNIWDENISSLDAGLRIFRVSGFVEFFPSRYRDRYESFCRISTVFSAVLYLPFWDVSFVLSQYIDVPGFNAFVANLPFTSDDVPFIEFFSSIVKIYPSSVANLECLAMRFRRFLCYFAFVIYPCALCTVICFEVGKEISFPLLSSLWCFELPQIFNWEWKFTVWIIGAGLKRASGFSNLQASDFQESSNCVGLVPCFSPEEFSNALLR